MADKDTSNQDDIDTSVDDVETPDDQEEDEGIDEQDQDDAEDEDESDDDLDDDSDDDDSDDEEDSEDEDEEPEFKKAFSTIKGDSPEEYIPNLEDAYRRSSQEGKKLAGEKKELQTRLDQINAAVAKNPDLEKLIQEATGEKAIAPTVDPAVAKVRQDYEEKVAKDLESFMAEKSLEEDSEEMDEFFENVAIVGQAARDKGKILDPMVAFKRAWGMMDHDDSKDKLVAAAKSTASKSKTPKAKKTTGKPSSKKALSDEQIKYAKKFGLTEKQLLDNMK